MRCCACSPSNHRSEKAVVDGISHVTHCIPAFRKCWFQPFATFAALAKSEGRTTTCGGLPHGSRRKRCAFPRTSFQKAQTISAWHCKPSRSDCPDHNSCCSRAHHAHPDPEPRHRLWRTFICGRRSV